MKRFLALALATSAVALLITPAAHADSVEENPDAEEDCTLTDQCPESGVACREIVDVCWARRQCPQSAVECGSTFTADVEACRADATAAGLELRCEESDYALYCQPGEKGEEQTCHDGARDEGLEERCIDRQFRTIYCDPAEDESGCAVESVGRRTPGAAALAVFLAAAAVTAVRASRRRRV